MKKQKKLLFKRGLAVFLVLTMCVGMLQMTAFAEETDEETSPEDDGSITVEYYPGDDEVHQVPDADDDDTGDTDVDTGDNDADTGDNDVDTGDNDADTGDNDADTGDNDADTGDNDVDTGDNDVDTGNNDADANTEEDDHSVEVIVKIPDGSTDTDEPGSSEPPANPENPDGSGETVPPAETGKPPIAEKTEEYEVDEDVVLDDIKAELTPKDGEYDSFDEERGEYTKKNGDNSTTTIKVDRDESSNSVTRTETTVETTTETRTLAENETWTLPEGATGNQDNFTYSTTGENGESVVKTVTRNADGSYTITTTTTSVKQTTKTLVNTENGKVTVKVTVIGGTSELLPGDPSYVTPGVEPDTTVDEYFYDSVNDLYDREGFKAVKTVKITASSLNVRNGAGQENTAYAGGSLKRNSIVYVYEAKPDKNGVLWYRIGDDAWISEAYCSEALEDGGQPGTKYEVLPDGVEGDRLILHDLNGTAYGYWVPGDKIEVYGKKTINGELYYACNVLYKGKYDTRYILASDIKDGGLKKIETPAYTQDDLNDLKDNELIYFDETALESAIRVPCASYNSGTAEIRILRDKNGNPYYVYCVQHGEADRKGYKYTMLELDENDPQGLEAQAKAMGISVDQLKQVMAITTNGYWGVTDEPDAQTPTVGSLETLTKKVLADLEKQKAEKPEDAVKLDELIQALKDGGLTDGVALAATQGALWYYTSGESLKTLDNFEKWIEYVGKKYDTNSEDGKNYLHVVDIFKTLKEQGKDNQIKALEAVYNYLASADRLTDPNSTPPTAITGDNFLKDVTIKVTGKAEVEKSETSEDATNKEILDAAKEASKDVYTADVSFTMAVTPSTINDDLIVTIIADDVELRTVRIAGTNKDGEDYEFLSLAENGQYVIKGVNLPNGAKINIKLKGTQNMGRGVYVFTADGSQNFAGISGEDRQQEINLIASLTFEVDSAKAEIETEIKNYNTSLLNPVTQFDEDDDGDDDDVIPGDDDDDDTPPTTTTTTPPTEVSVPEEPTPLAEVPEEETPLAQVPDEEDPLEEIPEEDVPLAEVPATGDISAMWYVMTLLAACGLVFMKALDGKKRRDGES